MTDEISVFNKIKCAQQKHNIGIKYNEIVEDICYLYDIYIVRTQCNTVLNTHTLYTFLFNRYIDFKQHYEMYSELYSFLLNKENNIFLDFFINALNDPPGPWWREQEQRILAHKPI
jgi:hypothetical protein